MAEFTTSDLLQAAFVETRCRRFAELRPQGDGTAIFVFPDCEEVRDAGQAFVVDGVIAARSFARRVGILRSRCRKLRQLGPIENHVTQRKTS